MKKCHWFEMEKAPDKDKFFEGLDNVETLFDIRGQNTIRLMYCKTCGQLYLKTFIEIFWEGTDNDDMHVFTAPVSENDLEELRKDKEKCYEYYTDRKHYVWYSGFSPGWSTNSLEGILLHTFFK